MDAQELYEHNPLRKQVMYMPMRDQVYGAKVDEKEKKKEEKCSEEKPKKCVFCTLSEDDASHDKKNLLNVLSKYDG